MQTSPPQPARPNGAVPYDVRCPRQRRTDADRRQALLLASIALRREATPDVSWLITMCERIRNGERAYIDIVETTPPVPMLLYMPGALLSKYVGGSSEIWTFAFAYASAL